MGDEWLADELLLCAVNEKKRGKGISGSENLGGRGKITTFSWVPWRVWLAGEC